MVLKKQVCFAITGVIGAALVIGGGLFYILLPSIVHSQVMKSMKLENGTPAFDVWIEKPLPVYKKFYFFNVTNPQDIISKSSKPILQEVGPYVFRERRRKVDIIYQDNGETISYKQLLWYEYQPNKSIGSLEDNVTILNIPFASVASKTDVLGFAGKLGLIPVISLFKPTPFVTKTIDELLFKGYEDKFIMFLQNLTKQNDLPNGTFGLLYGKNQSYENYSINTGIKDPEKYLQIFKWNNFSSLPWWGINNCSRIYGTDGSAFKPFLTPKDRLHIFVDTFCRSFYMNYTEVKYIHKIKTYRYEFPINIMASPDIEPENKCFCKKNKKCLKTGVFDISACQQDAPIVLSMPHFYQSDDSYYQAVIGLNRSEKLHNFFLHVEPTVGAIVKIRSRLQINVAVKSFSSIKVFENFTDMLFPIMWFEINSEWPSKFAEDFRNKVFTPQKMGDLLVYVTLCIGNVILLCIITAFILRKKVNWQKSIK